MLVFSRKGSAKTTERDRINMPKPPNIPTLIAAIVLAMAKSHPNVPDVIRNIAGSIKGEASQNAMTAPSGAPSANNAAMNGITSHEQNGDNPPSRAAMITMRTGLPSNAWASRFSAPEAFRKATARTANRMKGAVLHNDAAVLVRVVGNCPGSSRAINAIKATDAPPCASQISGEVWTVGMGL